MPTILTLFKDVLRKLTPAEVDQNFINLKATADAAVPRDPDGNLNLSGWFKSTTAGVTASYRLNNGTAEWWLAGGIAAGSDGKFGIYHQTKSTSPFVIDEADNIGIGCIPSPWYSGSRAIDIDADGAVTGTNALDVAVNGYKNTGAVWTYKQNGYSSIATQYSGNFYWSSAPSGNAGAPISYVSRMILDGNGNLLLGVASSAAHQFNKNVAENTAVVAFSSNGTVFANINSVTGGGCSGTASGLYINKNSVTSRSINMGGTINASGADYAEYETKSETCGTVAKGQIIGFDLDGLVTDKWSEARSFGVKSTDPNLVGGDTWGTEEFVGKKPEQPVFQQPGYTGSADPGPPPDPVTDQWTAAKQAYDSDQAAYLSAIQAAEADHAAALAQYEADLSVWEAKLEAARQKVDRIAYAGKVPVNVLGATTGDYIIAVAAADGIGITGQAVAAPSFEQYQKAVGRVRKILSDGRAEIAVIAH